MNARGERLAEMKEHQDPETSPLQVFALRRIYGRSELFHLAICQILCGFSGYTPKRRFGPLLMSDFMVWSSIPTVTNLTSLNCYLC
jgi:hypothetical protein